MNEKTALIALSSFVPLGPLRLKLMVSHFGGADKVWNANEEELLELGLSRKLTAGFIRHKNKFDVDDYFNELKKRNIQAVTIKEKNYPKNLKEIEDAPLVLYIKGKILAKDKKAIAIVGSRRMTSYGKEMASSFSRQLSKLGITIVSGLARGIDTEAHRATLWGNGRTIAVLGCGLDRVYPLQNYNLAQRILKKGGAIVSEYPLGYPVYPSNFANRNRIISGLSKAVLVIEGAARSGTLLTASRAAEQGRQVFAIPGQITSHLSAAPHFLIANGAKMVTKIDDILDEVDFKS